jgi:hypothetical protein
MGLTAASQPAGGPRNEFATDHVHHKIYSQDGKINIGQ